MNLDPHTVTMMGAMAGALSISIAIYFQMVYQKRCPGWYVLAFLIFGIIMVSINIDPAVSTSNANVIEAVAYAILIGFEFGIALILQRKMQNRPDDLELKTLIREVK